MEKGNRKCVGLRWEVAILAGMAGEGLLEEVTSAQWSSGTRRTQPCTLWQEPPVSRLTSHIQSQVVALPLISSFQVSPQMPTKHGISHARLATNGPPVLHA